MNDDLEKRGQTVAAVHQRRVFDVLGDIVEEITDDEGRAGQTQRDGDHHNTQQRVEQLGIHQYIQNTDEQQNTGEQAQNQEQLLQKVSARKAHARERVTRHQADNHFASCYAEGKNHRIAKCRTHRRNGVLSHDDSCIQEAEVGKRELAVRHKRLRKEGHIDGQNRQTEQNHHADGNMLLAHLIAGAGFITLRTEHPDSSFPYGR